MRQAMATGYFGTPDRLGGPVHIVIDGKPACGAKIHPTAEFQWCAHGIQSDFVECRRCQVSKPMKEHQEQARLEWERRMSAGRKR